MTSAMEEHARILWVDPPVSLATPATNRFGAARTVRPILTIVSDRVTRLTPTALPGKTRIGVRTSTSLLLRAQIRWAIRRACITPLAVVSTSLEDIFGARWGDQVVTALHGTDDYVAGAQLMGLSAARLRAVEKRAVTQADVVTALSPILVERWSAMRASPVELIPNGCTPVSTSARSLPSATRSLPKPVVGLIGRLNARIDLSLLEAIVNTGFSLLIVGPHDSRWEPKRFAALASRPHVHYVGRVAQEEVPSYISAVDVGITPYLDSEFNRASFPLKTLDYLSAGRPAVTTVLPAAQWLLEDLTQSNLTNPHCPILLAADSHTAFINALRRIVGDPRESGDDHRRLNSASSHIDCCRAFASRHSWSRRAVALATAIGLVVSADTLMNPDGSCSAESTPLL
jgi:teichuronic acid biosynthesis glycosyltransferase TuaH